jgi:hypothetical protein
MKIGKRSKHKHIVSKVLSNEKIKIYIAISLSEIHFQLQVGSELTLYY